MPRGLCIECIEEVTSRDPAGQSADFVQLLREFLAGYTAFVELFARYGSQDIPFARDPGARRATTRAPSSSG